MDIWGTIENSDPHFGHHSSGSDLDTTVLLFPWFESRLNTKPNSCCMEVSKTLARFYIFHRWPEAYRADYQGRLMHRPDQAVGVRNTADFLHICLDEVRRLDPSARCLFSEPSVPNESDKIPIWVSYTGTPYFIRSIHQTPASS